MEEKDKSHENKNAIIFDSIEVECKQSKIWGIKVWLFPPCFPLRQLNLYSKQCRIAKSCEPEWHFA